jgi:hypothetical protein
MFAVFGGAGVLRVFVCGAGCVSGLLSGVAAIPPRLARAGEP